MRSKLVQRQLIAFAAVTVLAVTLLLVTYVRLPAHLGVGRYEISVAMSDASGLYVGAPVTLRGSEVGEVSALELTPTGVVARLNLEDGTDVPAGSQVQVTHGSVIGEPYINLVYRSGQRRPLHAGALIPASHVVLPTSTGQLFTKANELLRDLPAKDLTTTIDESYDALAGNQDALTSLLTSSEQLTAGAAAAQGPTHRLVTGLSTVLATQAGLRDQIALASSGLDTVTGTLATKDPELRSILAQGPPTAAQASDLLTALQTDLPPLLIATQQLGSVLWMYQPALRHILIALPALIEANKSVQHYDATRDYGESGLSFKLQVNDPPTCSIGFPEAGHQRSPQDWSPAPLPADSYCKVAHDDPRVVRGARNFPCPNEPGRRAATAEGCGLVFDPKEVK